MQIIIPQIVRYEVVCMWRGWVGKKKKKKGGERNKPLVSVAYFLI